MTRREAPVRISYLARGWWLWRCWCCRSGGVGDGWSPAVGHALRHLTHCRPARRLLAERRERARLAELDAIALHPVHRR